MRHFSSTDSCSTKFLLHFIFDCSAQGEQRNEPREFWRVTRLSRCVALGCFSLFEIPAEAPGVACMCDAIGNNSSGDFRGWKKHTRVRAGEKVNAARKNCAAFRLWCLWVRLLRCVVCEIWWLRTSAPHLHSVPTCLPGKVIFVCFGYGSR